MFSESRGKTTEEESLSVATSKGRRPILSRPTRGRKVSNPRSENESAA
jgi:hypothetical protein